MNKIDLSENEVILPRWIPKAIDIHGNEKTDRAAKENLKYKGHIR